VGAVKHTIVETLLLELKVVDLGTALGCIDKQHQSGINAIEHMLRLQLKIFHQFQFWKRTLLDTPGKPVANCIIPPGGVTDGIDRQLRVVQESAPRLLRVSDEINSPSQLIACTVSGILPRAWVAQDKHGS